MYTTPLRGLAISSGSRSGSIGWRALAECHRPATHLRKDRPAGRRHRRGCAPDGWTLTTPGGPPTGRVATWPGAAIDQRIAYMSRQIADLRASNSAALIIPLSRSAGSARTSSGSRFGRGPPRIASRPYPRASPLRAEDLVDREAAVGRSDADSAGHSARGGLDGKNLPQRHAVA